MGDAGSALHIYLIPTSPYSTEQQAVCVCECVFGRGWVVNLGVKKKRRKKGPKREGGGGRGVWGRIYVLLEFCDLATSWTQSKVNQELADFVCRWKWIVNIWGTFQVHTNSRVLTSWGALCYWPQRYSSTRNRNWCHCCRSHIFFFFFGTQVES